MKNKIRRKIFMGDKMGNPNCLSLNTLSGSNFSDDIFVSWTLESGDRVIENINRNITIDFQGSFFKDKSRELFLKRENEEKKSSRRLDSLKNEFIRRLC